MEIPVVKGNFHHHLLIFERLQLRNQLPNCLASSYPFRLINGCHIRKASLNALPAPRPLEVLEA